MQAGQDGEDRLFALADLLIQYIVGLVELCETRGAIDNGNGIDIVKPILAVVDDCTQLLWRTRG